MSMQFLKNHLGIVFLLIIVLLGLYAVSSYNGLVSMDEQTASKWSNVEVQYQRRADLIPNLVNTVKGYATHEKETLEGLTALRAKTFQTAPGQTPSADQLKQFDESQSAITSALGRLIAISENYPDLKAHQEIADAMQQNNYLQREITAARTVYNNRVTQWNTEIFSWPTKMIVAASQGYTTRIPFTASAETKQMARSKFF